MSPTERQTRILEAARAWGEREERVRALLLTGSLGRDEGDALSDLDLAVVSQPGLRVELWNERRAVAEALGRPLGLFRDVPWPDPFLAIALYEGPTKVDLSFHDGAVEPTPWLRPGFETLLDKGGVAERLREELATVEPAAGLDGFHADPFELDAHAWDFAWWLHTKLRRGERWLVYTRLALFVELIVLAGWNAAKGQGWAGATGAGERLDPELVASIEAALPRAAAADELRRSLRALVDLYAAARPELAARFGVALPEELMEQVRAHL